MRNRAILPTHLTGQRNTNGLSQALEDATEQSIADTTTKPLSNPDDAHSGPESPPTSSARRRHSDARKRQAGWVRVSVWLSDARLEDLEVLEKMWGFKDRQQAIDVAIRHLINQSRTLGRLDL